MGKKILCFVLFILGLTLLTTKSFGNHEITYFQNNKKGAVTITFDDGYSSQVTEGIPLLNARSLKGTFFAVTMPDWINSHVSWEAYRNVAGQGHEIGSHAVNNLDLTTLPEADMRWELSESQKMINENIPSQFCRVFAYPFAKSNTQVQNAASDYYIAARGAWAPEGGFLNHYEDGPTWKAIDFFNIGSYEINNDSTIADLDYYMNLAMERHAWFCVHFYGVTNKDFFGQFLDHLLTRDLWIDTFGTIVRYMQERLFSTLALVSESPSEIRLNLSHPLDSAIYNLPLTIRSMVPSSWKAVKVKQGDSFSIVTSIEEGGDTVIYYNALPNQGEIVLSDGNQRFIYVANNPSSRIDSNDYIMVKDILSEETKSFLYTYNKNINPLGWANPEGMTFLGKRLFITGSISMQNKSSMIWEIDPNTGKEISSFSIGSGWSRGLGSDGTHFFVSQYFGNDYKIYKYTASGDLIDSFKVPANMSGLAYGRGYLFGASRNKVYRIDPNSKTVVTTFSLPWNNLTGLDFVDDPNPYLLVSVLSSNTVYRVGLDSNLNFDGATATFCTVPGKYNKSVALFP